MHKSLEFVLQCAWLASVEISPQILLSYIFRAMRSASPGGHMSTAGGHATGSTSGGTGARESLVDRFNTMSRVRRRKQEAEELAAEARQAMEDPLHPITPEIGPVGYQLAEGEECSMIEPHSKVC